MQYTFPRCIHGIFPTICTLYPFSQHEWYLPCNMHLLVYLFSLHAGIHRQEGRLQRAVDVFGGPFCRRGHLQTRGQEKRRGGGGSDGEPITKTCNNARMASRERRGAPCCRTSYMLKAQHSTGSPRGYCNKAPQLSTLLLVEKRTLWKHRTGPFIRPFHKKGRPRFSGNMKICIGNDGGSVGQYHTNSRTKLR